MTPMKQIIYRGGIARFCLPASWVEEYDPAGGGTFYEDRPESGTLRINVMDFERPPGDGNSNETAHDLISEIAQTNSVKSLANGIAIAHTTQKATEEGEELVLHHWQIGVCVTPTHFRVIAFTYTILAKNEDSDEVKRELEMLDESISSGQFPAIKGVAGNYEVPTK